MPKTGNYTFGVHIPLCISKLKKKMYFRAHLQNKNFKCHVTALYYNERHLGAKNRGKKSYRV